MILTSKECKDIIDNLHKIHELVDYETIDSFKNKEKIRLHFINTETGKNYKGVFEKGEGITKSFKYEEVK